MMGSGLVTAIVVLLADQATKFWVLGNLEFRQPLELLPVLDLTLVRNPGVTFGLLPQGTGSGSWVLAMVAIAIIVGLAVWMYRADRKLIAISVGAIAGGAIGNVLDRIRYGSVVDFIHAHAWGYSWYVFNIADAAIVCGVTVMILDGLRPGTRPDQAESA